MRCMIAAIVALSAVSAWGQIIYEPVQYQHGGQNPYYYAGSDPRVHYWAAFPSAPGAAWGRGNGFAFASGNVQTHREVVSERTRVFTDGLPFRNAFVYGMTPDDARNEAYAATPLYYRKRDMLRAAQQVPGGFVVPAAWDRYTDAGTIEIKPYVPGQSKAAPRPLMVIPKDLLEKQKPAQRVVATAK